MIDNLNFEVRDWLGYWLAVALFAVTLLWEISLIKHKRILSIAALRDETFWSLLLLFAIGMLTVLSDGCRKYAVFFLNFVFAVIFGAAILPISSRHRQPPK